ncbi:MAG: hypothetical protein ACE5K9_12000 [Candidatus Methylomirabilales bacterium]
MIRRCARLALAISAAVLLSFAAANACSVCGGKAIGTDPGAGFNSSILFLLSMPYAVAGVIAGWLIYTYWRAAGRRRKRPPVPSTASIEAESGN